MQKEKIKQSAKNVVDFVSSYTIEELVKGVASGQINIDRNQLEQVVSMIKQLNAAGYALAEATFERELNNLSD